MTEFLQYGGDHYKKAGNLQHWDMVAAMGHSWEYYVDRSAAYITRVKDTALDPKKAGHFVDKLLALIDAGELLPAYSPRPTQHNVQPGFDEYMQRYFKANNIDPKSLEASSIYWLMLARTRDDLVRARAIIARFERGEKVLGGPAATPTPEETLNPTGDWPFVQPAQVESTSPATPYETPTQIVSGGGGDFGGGGATRSYGDDRVFMVGDTSNDPMPAETCSRSDYSSSSDSGSGGGSSD